MKYPRGAALSDFLGIEAATAKRIDFDELFRESLTGPIDELFARPRKSLRNSLVELGFSIAARHLQTPPHTDISSLCKVACDVLESFHTGSLVVDDIEDGSLYRRGQKSLHHLHGIPKALNAGNWLYFLPFQMIEGMQIDPARKYSLLQECQRTLLKAHYGQALDLGVDITQLEQEKVHDVCLAAMELKSGALAGLGFSLGALTLGADETLRKRLERAGQRLGTALQMFDDVGNISSKSDLAKKCEDLKLQRCGFILASASRQLDSRSYRRFMKLSAELPESCDELLSFIDETEILDSARREARAFLSSTAYTLQIEVPLELSELKIIESIQSSLRGSYE